MKDEVEWMKDELERTYSVFLGTAGKIPRGLAVGASALSIMDYGVLGAEIVDLCLLY